MPHTLLFDLDGTLVDTAPDLIGATNHVLALRGLPQVADDVVRSSVGTGAETMLAAALAHAGVVPERDAVAGMLADFMTHYGVHLSDGSRPFPGAIAMLEACAARGWPLAVVTNKIEANALAVLDALGLRRYFGAVIGGDTLAVAKPHAAPLREACRRLGVPLAGAVMIGDSVTDARAAQAAGVPFIGVSFGYGPDFDAFGPVAIIEHFDNLISAVERLPARSATLATRSAAGAPEQPPRQSTGDPT